MTACHVVTRILKCLKFWSQQNLATGSWTMCKLFVNSSGWCMPVRTMPQLSQTAQNSSRTAHVQFTSSSQHVHEQFMTTARQWPARRCVGIYRVSWTLLAFPVIASKETTYITETTCCLKQSRQNGKIVAKSRASVSLALGKRENTGYQHFPLFPL